MQMKQIVFFSPNFYPMVGGIESIALGLATHLSHRGYRVAIITMALNRESDQFPFAVHRNIGLLKMWRLMRKADAVVHFNVSLKGVLPWLFSFRPLIVSHHGSNFDMKGNWTKFGRLKQFIADHLAYRNAACSNYLAGFFNNVEVVYSAYDPSIFPLSQHRVRHGDLVFVGRLTLDKGCSILLDALAILKKQDRIAPLLTVIGDGPEFESLSRRSHQELDGQVEFLGKRSPVEIADILKSHKIMVVPSLSETFGIAVLEGLACGCSLIASDVGGLPEAGGTLARYFGKADSSALAAEIKRQLTNWPLTPPTEDELRTHLGQFTIEVSTAKFSGLLESVD